MIERWRYACPDCESQSLRIPTSGKNGGRAYCQVCGAAKDRVVDLRHGRTVDARGGIA